MKKLLVALILLAGCAAAQNVNPGGNGGGGGGGASPAGSAVTDAQCWASASTFGVCVSEIWTAIAAPSTPAAGKGVLYIDSTSKNIAVKDDAGVVKHGVQTDTGTANNYISAISDAGAVTKSRPACATLSDSTAGCSSTNALIRTIGASLDGGGSALTTSSVAYIVVPFACTITGYNVLVDTGTISMDVWRIASGTAIPTVSDTILTGGYLAVATGTVNIVSGTGRFTSTAVTANDIFGFNIQAVSSATKVTVEVVCAAS